MRRARPSERDAVERSMRVGVEARRRVGDALGRARPLLQLRVVRRHDREPRLLREPREQRLRECGSLDGIGAGGELVDEHERSLPRRAQDRDQVGNVPGEGREAHLDRLPVADVCEHLVEDRQRNRLRRRAEAGLVEQRRQADRLQRHRLAAGVRAADHERAQRLQLEIDRHRHRGIEERVPGSHQPHLVRDLHGRTAPTPRDDPACERQVDGSHRLDEGDDRVRALADGA